MTNLIEAHGFRVRDGGKATIECLRPYVHHESLQQADYGYINLLRVRLSNSNISSTVRGMTRTDTYNIAIGHSNGCAILLEAARMGAPFRQMVFLNPALDADINLPIQVDKLHVFHNPTDKAVWLADRLLFHKWGDMGRDGYKGADARVKNYDLEALFGYEGHSGHIKAPHKLGEFINVVTHAER